MLRKITFPITPEWFKCVVGGCSYCCCCWWKWTRKRRRRRWRGEHSHPISGVEKPLSDSCSNLSRLLYLAQHWCNPQNAHVGSAKIRKEESLHKVEWRKKWLRFHLVSICLLYLVGLNKAMPDTSMRNHSLNSKHKICPFNPSATYRHPAYLFVLVDVRKHNIIAFLYISWALNSRRRTWRVLCVGSCCEEECL